MIFALVSMIIVIIIESSTEDSITLDDGPAFETRFELSDDIKPSDFTSRESDYGYCPYSV